VAEQPLGGQTVGVTLMSGAAAAIEVEGLRKSYGAYEAVRGVDFSVAAGEAVAFLGPNGAGKTTTVEILEGYRAPTAGQVSVLGLSPTRHGKELRRRVGIVLQEAGFPQELTVAELVEAWRRLYSRPLAADQVIHSVGLDERRNVRAKNLSGGESRRLDLALGIVGQPEVLFLDEPTTGFDPSARRTAWELISGLVGGGMTLFLTTHYLEEAQRLADRILIIAGGRIVAEGSPEEIGGREQAPGTVRFVRPAGVPDEAVSAIAGLPADSTLEIGEGGLVTVSSHELVAATHAVTSWALRLGLELAGFAVERRTLEDTYLSIIGAVGTEPTAVVGAGGAGHVGPP
jgi:ABC-2 type transport system ATP-binding protein